MELTSREMTTPQEHDLYFRAVTEMHMGRFTHEDGRYTAYDSHHDQSFTGESIPDVLLTFMDHVGDGDNFTYQKKIGEQTFYLHGNVANVIPQLAHELQFYSKVLRHQNTFPEGAICAECRESMEQPLCGPVARTNRMLREMGR